PATAFGWNRSAPGADAAHAAGFEVSTDLPATLRRAADRDALVVVGVPLPALGPVLDAVAEHAPSVALTDVVSVKSPVLEAVRVGGHRPRSLPRRDVVRGGRRRRRPGHLVARRAAGAGVGGSRALGHVGRARRGGRPHLPPRARPRRGARARRRPRRRPRAGA